MLRARHQKLERGRVRAHLLQLGDDVLVEKVDEVDKLVGLRGAELGGAALDGERDDEEDGHVFGLPAVGAARRKRGEQRLD
eukprot:3381837-Pleurochrysis_carterae.AAC.1